MILKSIYWKITNYIGIGDKWVDDMLKVLLLLNADETVILAENGEDISNVLKAMENYCEKWEVDINCRKT